MIKFNKRTLLYFMLLLAMISALFGLTARLRDENSNKTVAFIAEYKDIASLSYQTSEPKSEIWHKINALGVIGVAVSEFTGEELTNYTPLPVRYGAAGTFSEASFSNVNSNRAVLRYSSSLPYASLLRGYIEKKLPASEFVSDGGYEYIILPGTVDEFKFSSFVPDFAALEFAAENKIPTLFRPGPCTPASGKNVADAFAYLLDEFPLIKNIIPAGMVAPGYPDLEPLAALMRERGITLSQVEFIKQIGVPQLAQKVGRFVIPMHSLTRDEIISRNISRTTINDRFIRAVHERSIRFIMVHPYDLQMGGRDEIFVRDL
ncbi:MAG: hypothetical protein HUJ86_00920, partial [Synergistes sp.]|nr:hypothetical protein [Synergistes sp.]